MRGCIGVVIAGVAVGLAAAPAVAAADPALYENSHWTRVGVEGAVVSDGHDVGSVGAQFAIGQRLGTAHLVGEYALSQGWRTAGNETQERLGFGHRLGASLALPVTFARMADRSMEIAFWLEAGGGAHRLAGSDTWRPNAFIGWAAEYRGYRSSRDRGGGGMGMWLGGRALVSEPDPDTRAIAVGSPAPQGGPRFGIGFIGTLAWRWGR